MSSFLLSSPAVVSFVGFSPLVTPARWFSSSSSLYSSLLVSIARRSFFLSRSSVPVDARVFGNSHFGCSAPVGNLLSFAADSASCVITLARRHEVLVELGP